MKGKVKKEINLEDIKEVSKMIKKLDADWASNLSKIMKISETELYNITNGSVKNQLRRIAFVNAAKPYFEKLKKEQSSAIEALEEIIYYK